MKVAQVTHPCCTFASTPPPLSERTLAGLQMVQVLEQKGTSSLDAVEIVDRRFRIVIAATVDYREIKATVSPQLTSLSPMDALIKV